MKLFSLKNKKVCKFCKTEIKTGEEYINCGNCGYHRSATIVNRDKKLSELTEEESKTYANAIRKAVEDLKIPHEKNSISSFVTISVGLLSISPKEKITEDEIYKKADDLLYKAKESGRNRVCAQE